MKLVLFELGALTTSLKVVRNFSCKSLRFIVFVSGNGHFMAVCHAFLPAGALASLVVRAHSPAHSYKSSVDVQMARTEHSLERERAVRTFLAQYKSNPFCEVSLVFTQVTKVNIVHPARLWSTTLIFATPPA